MSDRRMTKASQAVGIVSVRELSRNMRRVIGAVAKSRRPALVTQRGKPVIALYPVEAGDWEDWVLANAPEFVEGMRKADEEFRRGETIGMNEVFARLERKKRERAPTRVRPKRAAKKRRG